MADLPDSKWGLLERPVLPTIRHVFRGPPDLCTQYVKLAEVILGKLRNYMSLGDVEIATRGIRLQDGTKIRVLRDPSSDILYIDTTETVGAPFWEFPYFDFSFIPKEHYESPVGDDGLAYFLGDETLPLSDDNPNPKRPMWGYHYTGHPYWKGLPDKGEVYQSNKAILCGNQFYFDAGGRNMVSWWHSPGGDLPIPIIRPGDYLATRGTEVFTLDINGYLPAVDPRDGPPVYTPFQATFRRQVILPNGSSAFTVPQLLFGHFTANYRFNLLPPQLYRNNRKWEQYDDVLTLLDDISFIAGYTRCLIPSEEDEDVYIHVSDFLVFSIDVEKVEGGPVIYMAAFFGIEEGYPTALFDISSIVAEALGFETALITYAVSYPWRFNSKGAEAMWIVSAGDSLLRGAVTNIKLAWLVFSIDVENATLTVVDKKILSYTLAIESSSSSTSLPMTPIDNSTSFFSSEIIGSYYDCFRGSGPEPLYLEKTEYWLLADTTLSGTNITLDDTRTTSEIDNEVPAIYTYSAEDERIIASINGQNVRSEAINFTKKEDYIRSYWKRTEPYSYFPELWPRTDSVVQTPAWTVCPGGTQCTGTSETLTMYHRFLDNFTSYLDDAVGSSVDTRNAEIMLVSNNGLNIKLVERTFTANVDSLYEAEAKLAWKTQDDKDAFIYHNTTTADCTSTTVLSEVTQDIDEEQVNSYLVSNTRHDIAEDILTTRVLTYSNLAKGIIEYKEHNIEYTNSMNYVDSTEELESRIHTNYYRYNSSLPFDTGLIITTTYPDDETVALANSIYGTVSYELRIKSIIFDFINNYLVTLYEADGYINDDSKTIAGSSFTQLSPGYFGTSSSSEERLFYTDRLRQYFDRFSSFSGMVDLSNTETMRYLYSELHEKAYQMYLHDPVVLGAFFSEFEDQFVVGSGIETNTPERDFLLENLPATEEHRSLYPIALVRNRARVYGNPPTRIEKVRA